MIEISNFTTDENPTLTIKGEVYSLMEVIYLRNYLTEEIDRVQIPVLDMFKGKYTNQNKE